jgi:hypothetical protein
MTLRLLYRPIEHSSLKRNRTISKTKFVDLEAGDGETAPLDLGSYPIWRHRLAEVQDRYNAARPGALRQWWYDRRKKSEWATLWIAIVVFVLTVFFGLISSITSIMQVYAAFRVLPISNVPAQAEP